MSTADNSTGQADKKPNESKKNDMIATDTAIKEDTSIAKPVQSLPKKPQPTLNEIFKFENNKVILNEKNEFKDKAKQKIMKLLNFINKQGIYDIKINLENVVKKLKLEQFSHTKEYSVDNIKKFINNSSPFLLVSGLIVIIDEKNIVHLALPKFFLDRDTFDKSFEEFMDIITNENFFSQIINLARPYIKKLFTRINRDGNGKAIFSNMLDSLIKLGLTFSLSVHQNVRRDHQVNLIPYFEYFSNFVIENITTMVSDKCRSKTLEKDLFDNDMKCIVPKLVENCPKCPPCKIPDCPRCEIPECPKLSCPKVNCPECPDCNCPSCPEPEKCPECPDCNCPSCPEPEKCPEVNCPSCPEPKVCPEPEKCPEQSNTNMYIAGGIISVLVIVIIFLLTKKGNKTM